MFRNSSIKISVDLLQYRRNQVGKNGNIINKLRDVKRNIY